MLEETNETKELEFLNRDAILKQDDLVKERVDIPEWNGFVYVRSMTAAERDEFEIDMLASKDENSDEKNMDNFRSRLCARTIVNAKGKRMFSVDDIPALGNKSALALARLYNVATRINGIGQKVVEDLTKN